MKKLNLNAGALKTLILVMGLQVAAVHAQGRPINYQPESLAARIQKISRETGKNIAYSQALLSRVQAAAVSADSPDVDALLKQSLSGTGFTYRKLDGGSYMIFAAGQQQSGRITGTIVNEVGEPVAGATISVGGQTVSTGNNGEFAVDLPAGTYTLTVDASGFAPLTVQQLTVKANETATVSFVMKATKEKETAIKGIVITAVRKADTQAGLLTQQKKAAQMSDGISAEQIAKTPDSDVGGTLKRVTGVTTVDNKYVVVRSMGERWNTAAMDGVNLPSTEAYNNNFSFDIIPTAMVESVVVSKTSTPDMNANFAGGYVEVKTKDIPNQDFLTVSLGSSYNSVATFKEFLTKQRGKYDYWGYDDGTRDFPKGLVIAPVGSPLFFEQSRQFKNDNFTNYRTTGDLNSSMQLAFGKSFKLKNSNKWGIAGAITVRNEQNKLDIEHTARGNWLENVGNVYKDEPVKFYDFQNKGASYNYNSTLAGMLNFGLQVGKTRVSLRNSYTHIFDNTLTRITGWNEYTGGSGSPAEAEIAYNYFYNGVIPDNDPSRITALDAPYTTTNNYPVFQTLLQNKLDGSHKLGGTEISWFVARTDVASDTKDYTEYLTMYKFTGLEKMAYHSIYNSAANFLRGYIENRETDYNYGLNFKWSLNTDNFKNEFKAGYAGAYKNNTNEQRIFFIRVDENRNVPNNEKNYLYLYGALREWLDGSHYAPGGIGWTTKPLYTDAKFEGEVTQHSPFIMLDNRWRKFRLVWGVRAEYFKYNLLSQQIDEADNRRIDRAPIEEKPWQWMPSANFTYSPTTKMNLRLAYYRTVMRPQFNERTGLPYTDPVANGLVYNTAMTSSIANNYDFKYEWFPALGEILSAGVYYKDIDRPIEREGYHSNEGNLFLFNGNSRKAKLFGLEAEVRKSLGFLVRNSFLEQLYLAANFTYNDTRVTAFTNKYKATNDDETYEVKRPLYGQTPYAFNVGLMYEGERLGASFLVNGKGDQYITVGYGYKEEEIQRPYLVADAQLSYKMLRDKNLEFKLSAKNIFNRVKEYYNNQNSYSVPAGTPGGVKTSRQMYSLLPGATDRYDKEIDRILFRAYTGTTIGLSVNYKF